MKRSLCLVLCLAIELATSRIGIAGERAPDAPSTTTPPTTAPAATPPPPPDASPPAPAEMGSAQPLPPPIDSRVHLDAMLGFGSDNLNLGLGARGGKTLDNHIYVGGAFVYHVGTSASATVEGMTVSSSVSGFYIGPEVGYDIAVATLGPMIVRPYLGLGFAYASASSSVGVSSSSSELSIWPGVACHYLLSDSKYEIGADLRAVTGPWGTSLGVFVLGGMHIGS